jgi:glycosyltransferase involved in cell wall biosynthesis
MNGLENDLACSVSASYLVNLNVFFQEPFRSFPTIKNKYYQNFLYSKSFKRVLATVSSVRTLADIKEGNFDVLHLTDHYSSYLKYAKIKKPVVLTIHDMIPELFPSHFSDIQYRLKQRLESIQMADYFICISESTKRDFIAFYGISEDKIKVIYHGFSRMNQASFVPLVLDDYLLYVGDRKSVHKNFCPMVLQLADTLKQDRLKLICVGDEFSNLEKNLFRKLGIESDVTSVKANDYELNQLYAHAICFLYPSIYEGFGMPLLEAMRVGCPVLTSNTSSMPEIARDGALYFNPISFADFDFQLQRIMHGESRNILHKQQVDVLEQYGWDKMCQSTHAYYSAIIA